MPWMTGPAKSLDALCGQKERCLRVPSADPQLHLVPHTRTARELADLQKPKEMPQGHSLGCEARLSKNRKGFAV